MNTREAIARAIMVLEDNGRPRDKEAAERFRQIVMQHVPEDVGNTQLEGKQGPLCCELLDLWIDG